MPARSQAPEMSDAELLRTVVSNAPIVMFAFDLDGIFTLSEGRGLDALGLKPGEVVGRSVFKVYKDYPLILDACRRALKGETVVSVAPVQGLAFETRYAPKLDWGGKVSGVLGVATDVTEAYRCLLSKDEFLSVISHELRTPLSSATGWACLLQEGELDAGESRKALETICRNLDDMKRIILELRDASHAATGAMRLKVKSTDLGPAVREAARSLAAAAKAKDHRLEIDAPSLKGAFDKARVRQIAWILLSNAIKYSPKGSAITARLERRGDEARLIVSDEGPGIPVALRSQLFDLLRMPAADLPSRGRGLGLGLSIARRLAELHGGTIEFSDESGAGAIFTAHLPLLSRKGTTEL